MMERTTTLLTAFLGLASAGIGCARSTEAPQEVGEVLGELGALPERVLSTALLERPASGGDYLVAVHGPGEPEMRVGVVGRRPAGGTGWESSSEAGTPLAGLHVVPRQRVVDVDRDGDEELLLQSILAVYLFEPGAPIRELAAVGDGHSRRPSLGLIPGAGDAFAWVQDPEARDLTFGVLHRDDIVSGCESREEGCLRQTQSWIGIVVMSMVAAPDGRGLIAYGLGFEGPDWHSPDQVWFRVRCEPQGREYRCGEPERLAPTPYGVGGPSGWQSGVAACGDQHFVLEQPSEGSGWVFDSTGARWRAPIGDNVWFATRLPFTGRCTADDVRFRGLAAYRPTASSSWSFGYGELRCPFGGDECTSVPFSAAGFRRGGEARLLQTTHTSRRPAFAVSEEGRTRLLQW